MIVKKLICSFFPLLVGLSSSAQISNEVIDKATTSEEKGQVKMRARDTEVWEPVPSVVKPGKVNFSTPPSDAVVLFDEGDLKEWVNVKDKSPAQWIVNGDYFTVNKEAGDIETIRKFADYQLHIEWRIPANIDYSGQDRGNSGVFLASTEGKAGGYEIQVLEGYNNENRTYANGMVGSIYKAHIPLVNPAKKAGEWNSYDIVWKAPVFNDDGTVKEKARVTAFLNGILIQNNVEIEGETAYIGKHEYYPHGASPIKLQAHGDPSIPIDYRNIWLREL